MFHEYVKDDISEYLTHIKGGRIKKNNKLQHRRWQVYPFLYHQTHYGDIGWIF